MDKWLLQLIDKYEGWGIVLFVLISTGIATILGAAIGVERQSKGASAGIKTHALLAVGCSLMMTLSIWAIRVADGILIFDGNQNLQTLSYDSSRIAAGVVTGIGFLGAGVIIKDKFSVKGLTSAASIWICSAIGLACGVGFVIEAILVTILTLVLLISFGHISSKVFIKLPSIIVTCQKDFPIIEECRKMCDRNGIIIKNTTVESIDEKETVLKITFSYITNKLTLKYLANQFLLNENITKVDVLNIEKKQARNKK